MASSYPLPFSIYSFRCLAHASAIDCSPRIPRVPKSREPWLLLCTSYAHNTRPVLLVYQHRRLGFQFSLGASSV